MFVNGKNTLVKDNAGTQDIIQALCNVVPVAVDQCKGDIDSMIFKSGDPLVDAERCCRYIRSNVKYKADGFSEQNIQLPGRMFQDTKQADCKSFSLAFVGMMGALGYDCGFRFASYRPNKIPTHVYNFVLCNGKKYIFDACVENLKESPRHTYLQDMKVQYLTGVPIMTNDLEYIGKKGRGKKFLKNLGKGVKKVTLSPVRNAFLALVRLNARGLATKLNVAVGKDKSTTVSMWEKVGGKFDSLQNAINAGKNKKPLAGESKKNRGVKGIEFYPGDSESSYIGEYDLQGERIGVVAVASVVALIAAAAPILIAASKLFKKNNIPEDEGGSEGDVVTPEEKEDHEPLPEGFEAADPEGSSGGLNLGFKPSPIMIGGIVGGLALVYFLMKKKK